MVRRGSPRPAAWGRFIRQLHLYLAALLAPAILFFAFTGGLQVLSLHKSNVGAAYEAPAWIVRLAAVHKRQTLAPKADDDAAKPEVAKHGGRAKRAERRPAASSPWTVAALKAFAVALSLGLMGLTLSGLYMAFRFSRRPRVVLALVLGGLVAPLLLLIL